MQNTAGTITYTRDGSFSLSPAGQLVSSDGSLVQGWTAVNGVVNPSGAVSSISVPSLSSQAPTPTSNMTVAANLNASAAVGDSFSAPVQVVDSLGNTHTLTVSFTNTAPLTWKYDVTIPGEDLTGGTAGTPSSLTTGTLTFRQRRCFNVTGRWYAHQCGYNYGIGGRRRGPQYQLEFVRFHQHPAGHAVCQRFHHHRFHTGWYPSRDRYRGEPAGWRHRW